MNAISYLSMPEGTYEIKDTTAREKLDEVCLNTLHITFSSEFLGQEYTVTGGGESYEGIVPDSLEVELGLLQHNTMYTVSCFTATQDIQTGEYFNHYNIELEPYPISFVDASWDEISRMSQLGLASSVWAIGDRHAVELNGTVGCLDFDHETYYAYIIGFDHNADIEGANRIHMQFGFDEDGNHIAFVDTYYNESGATGAYDDFSMSYLYNETVTWDQCAMRNTICPQFKDALPEDLQAVLNTVTKYTASFYETVFGTIAVDTDPTIDDIFLLAEYEVQGKRTYAYTSEQGYQEQYSYYSLGNSKIMCKHSNPSSDCYWWTRSVSSSNSSTYHFCSVNNNGSATVTNEYYSIGFAPAFTV